MAFNMMTCCRISWCCIIQFKSGWTNRAVSKYHTNSVFLAILWRTAVNVKHCLRIYDRHSFIQVVVVTSSSERNSRIQFYSCIYGRQIKTNFDYATRLVANEMHQLCRNWVTQHTEQSTTKVNKRNSNNNRSLRNTKTHLMSKKILTNIQLLWCWWRQTFRLLLITVFIAGKLCSQHILYRRWMKKMLKWY